MLKEKLIMIMMIMTMNIPIPTTRSTNVLDTMKPMTKEKQIMMELPMLRTCGGNISAVTTYCSTFAVQPIAKVDIHEYTVYLRLRIKVQFFYLDPGAGV